MANINITNFEELNNYLKDWVWEDFLPNTSKAELLNNSGAVHYMMCFLDMLEGYALDNLEADYEADVEDGLFDPKDNLIFKFFNEGHTLCELANEVFQLYHLEEYDPFGMYSYEGTWEVAVIAVQEFYKEVK